MLTLSLFDTLVFEAWKACSRHICAWTGVATLQFLFAPEFFKRLALFRVTDLFGWVFKSHLAESTLDGQFVFLELLARIKRVIGRFIA